MHALGLEFGSAAQLAERPGSVWNCLRGNALKRSPGIIRKSRVLYPCPGFLSSATWPSLPKKHYNGLNQTKPNKSEFVIGKQLIALYFHWLWRTNPKYEHGKVVGTFNLKNFKDNIATDTFNTKRELRNKRSIPF